MKALLIFLFICFNFIHCNFFSKKSIYSTPDKSYRKYRKSFDDKFIDQFPKIITNPDYAINCNTNELKNDVGLILYYYNVSESKIDSLKNKIQNIQVIGKYNSTDTCLLIVNRFETLETYNNNTIPIINDSSQIIKDCYTNLFPIPNFISYHNPDLNSTSKLGDKFSIYVFEARSGIFFKNFTLLPAPQMFTKWRNGFSKGIAYSEEKKVIIYWSIMW